MSQGFQHLLTPQAVRVLALLLCGLFAAGFFRAPAAAAGRHADPYLEELLPETLGGVVLTIESQSGPDLSTNSVAFDRFLASLGKTRSDFTVASAYAHDGLKAEIGAWRVRGIDNSDGMLAAFKQALQSSSASPLTIAVEIVGEKPVTRIGAEGQLARGPLYVFVRGDALLFVQTPEPDLAEEALSKLRI